MGTYTNPWHVTNKTNTDLGTTSFIFAMFIALSWSSTLLERDAPMVKYKKIQYKCIQEMIQLLICTAASYQDQAVRMIEVHYNPTWWVATYVGPQIIGIIKH